MNEIFFNDGMQNFANIIVITMFFSYLLYSLLVFRHKEHRYLELFNNTALYIFIYQIYNFLAFMKAENLIYMYILTIIIQFLFGANFARICIKTKSINTLLDNLDKKFNKRIEEIRNANIKRL